MVVVSFLIVQIAQKKCQVCGGSGLVTKNDYYVRCQECGKKSPMMAYLWRIKCDNGLLSMFLPQVVFFHGSLGEDSSRGERGPLGP
jgi:hypothetical protein